MTSSSLIPLLASRLEHDGMLYSHQIGMCVGSPWPAWLAFRRRPDGQAMKPSLSNGTVYAVTQLNNIQAFGCYIYLTDNSGALATGSVTTTATFTDSSQVTASYTDNQFRSFSGVIANGNHNITLVTFRKGEQNNLFITIDECRFGPKV